MPAQEPTRLDIVMTTLRLSSVQLSHHCSISNSLISRWRSGIRRLTIHSDAAVELASTLVKLDKDGELDPLLEPYLIGGADRRHAMWLYLIDPVFPTLQGTSHDTLLPTDEEYISHQYVLLGKRGFQKGALLMLDYLDRLPAGQETIVCALNSKELWHNDVMFALRFLRKLKRAISIGSRFTVIENSADSFRASPHFSAYWLTHNLKGTFRGRVFKGEAREYFVAAIPGYWGGRVEPDASARDGIISTFSTDTFHVRRDTELCRSFLAQCAPPSQYGFLSSPEGNQEYPRRWHTNMDPWTDTQGFSCVSRTPLFGIMTSSEFESLGGAGVGLSIPPFLFAPGRQISPKTQRLMFCADDLREALRPGLHPHAALSALLCERVAVPHQLMRQMVQRIVQALPVLPALRVALIPKRAFSQIGMELVTWADTLSIGWLPDASESLLDDEPTVVASFDSALEHLWSSLSPKWTNQQRVYRTLRQWLSGALDSGYPPDEPSESWSPYLEL